MRYTLEGCKHRRLESWGDDPTGKQNVTCLLCFQRFRLDWTDRRSLEDAAPFDGQCLHITSFLKPFERKGSSSGFDTAFCSNCGCVVEHPPGPGKWTPVLFYGYVINEE